MEGAVHVTWNVLAPVYLEISIWIVLRVNEELGLRLSFASSYQHIEVQVQVGR